MRYGSRNMLTSGKAGSLSAKASNRSKVNMLGWPFKNSSDFSQLAKARARAAVSAVGLRRIQRWLRHDDE